MKPSPKRAHTLRIHLDPTKKTEEKESDGSGLEGSQWLNGGDLVQDDGSSTKERTRRSSPGKAVLIKRGAVASGVVRQD